MTLTFLNLILFRAMYLSKLFIKKLDFVKRKDYVRKKVQSLEG